MIKLVVGLGNPGLQYEKTRHNAGFIFVDGLAAECGAKWINSVQFHGMVAECSVANRRLILLKPLTYMNRSGLSVSGLMRYFKIGSEEMLVVHDELDLPEGEVRFKRDGGHAGHNGLRDIIAHVSARDFYRLRIGIGRPAQGASVADYVLSAPSKDGLIALKNVFDSVSNRLDAILDGNVAAFGMLK